MSTNTQPQSARSLFRPLAWCAGALAAVSMLALPEANAEAQNQAGPFTVPEIGQSFGSLQQAVDAIGDRRGTIVFAPGVYRQCAVQQAGVITFIAAQAGTAVLEGVACESKASLVLRGQAAEVRGLTFRGIAVSDGNGAGIRLEKGDLGIGFTRFEDSQQGILTANDPSSQIVIKRSTFSGLGTCEHSAGCAHSVYIGNYGKLSISESRFERGAGGHYVKARVAEVEISDNSFDDAAGQGTNYMIDLPAGSQGTISDNWFVQGRDKQNYSAFIALGAEQILHPSDGLTVTKNEARFVPGLQRATTFLADWSGSRVVMAGNRLAQSIQQYEQR